MNSSYDTIVVGAGLAGACAAFYRSREAATLLVEAEELSAGASRAAAGLVNPFMGRRARKTWMADEALDALSETLHLAAADHLFVEKGVLRPASSEVQAADFKQAVFPGESTWLPRAAVAERYPDVRAPHGALFVARGGAISPGGFVDALVGEAREKGLEVRTARVTEVEEGVNGVQVAGSGGHVWHARTVILAPGAGYAAFPMLRGLRLHPVKGQVLEVTPPPELQPLPCISGNGYIAPANDGYVLGTSYEHDFEDLDSNPNETRKIFRNATAIVPSLSEARITGVRVGVRVTVPGIRKPMVGPVSEAGNVWVITGLGSKGLLMAPWIGRQIGGWLRGEAPVPGEMAVRWR